MSELAQVSYGEESSMPSTKNHDELEEGKTDKEHYKGEAEPTGEDGAASRSKAQIEFFNVDDLPKTEKQFYFQLDRLEYKDERKAIVTLVAILLALAALTAALPPTEPFKPTDANTAAINTGDTAWVIVASALVLFMTPGVAFFYGGAVNHKNVISTMYQSFICMGLISVLWVIVGFSLAFGKDANGSGILGYPRTFYMYNDVGATPDPDLASTIPLSIFSMFQLMFAIITPTLISGSLAERVHFHSWMLFACIWHLLVYCPLVHITWHPDGILRKWGYIDFAGGIPVEMASGYAALAGALFLGKRSSEVHRPANV